MMDQISSPPGVHPAPATSLTGEWRRYAAFLHRPNVPDRATGPDGRSLLATGRLLLLDYALMAVLMAVGFAAYLAGVEFPENELESLEWTLGTLALVVAGAPILEEIMFRGWLSGRLGHVLASILAVVALSLGGAAAAGAAISGSAVSPPLLLGAAALSALALALVYWLRHRGPPRWYVRAFPVFFWLSALGFAAIHIWNYAGELGPLVFALVIPQLIAGTIFAYARVSYGLWSAVLLHMLHNGTAVALAVLTTDLMG